MDTRRPPPEGGDPVMAEYFETMRHFLMTQERVMSAYLGEASGRPMPRALRAPQALALAHHGNRIATAADGADTPAAPPVGAAASGPIVVGPASRPEAHGANGSNGAYVSNGAHAANGANGSHAAHAPNGTVLTESVAASNGAADAALTNGSHAAAPGAGNGAPNGTTGGAITREQLTDMLLAIVEDKTGYPRDMVGLDQGLESDLGIDSIKRIEVVGAMLQALPDRYREALTDSRSKLNTQQTLNGMLEMLSAIESQGSPPRPFECA